MNFKILFVFLITYSSFAQSNLKIEVLEEITYSEEDILESHFLFNQAKDIRKLKNVEQTYYYVLTNLKNELSLVEMLNYTNPL